MQGSQVVQKNSMILIQFMIDGLFPHDLVDKSWAVYSSIDEFGDQID